MKNLTYLALMTLIVSCSSGEPKIYQFRGEDRNGIYQESNLLKEWPENGPEEILSIETLGNGFGSPVFTDDKFFITGEKDSMAILFSFSLEGEILWKKTLGREWMKSFPGSRMAPTIVDKLVYVGTGYGNLYCLNSEDGEIIWDKDFEKDFQGAPMLHGYTEAPVIDGDKIFWIPGGEVYNVVGLDRFTGDIIWSNKGFGERSAFNQGQLIKLPERNIYVTFSAYHLMGFDTETGELLWSQEQDILPIEKRLPGWGDTHPNSVIFDEGNLYYFAKSGRGGEKFALSEDGSEITRVWRNQRIDGFIGGLVKIGDYIYSEKYFKQSLMAVDANSGELSDSLRIGSGAIINADNMLYYYSSRGNMVLLSYHNGKMNQVSSFKITKGDNQHFSHPVINKGILYIRHGDVLMAYDIRDN